MYAVIHNRLCRRFRGCWYPVAVREAPSLTERVASYTQVGANNLSQIGKARRTDSLLNHKHR
jgi:hypothetical protein